MNIDRIVLVFAGFMVLLSVALTHFHSGHWVWLTVFIGVNLFQAGFSKFCVLAYILQKLGIKTGSAF